MTVLNDATRSAQEPFFDEDDLEALLEQPFDDDDLDDLDPEALEALEAMFDYEEQPPLLLDTDPDRAIARQKEMMDACFGGIGQETKEEKRMGLSMQQFDIEQRHALRLLLIYQDPAELAEHLKRCLDEPAYGYGERGDNGRTIAQAMAALAGGDLAGVAENWLAAHQPFQERVLAGTPLSFRSLFDYADLDSFVPLLQRLDQNRWRLGLEDEGQHRDFQGPLEKVWPQICDTYVQWSEADNEAWLSNLKRQAAKRPDTLLRAARADRLRKQQDTIRLEGRQVTLTTARDGAGWPRTLTLADAGGAPQLGLSRLSGHSFYELAWEGGLHVRRFEISGTTRNRIPFEHIELATALAEALGLEQGLQPEPVTAPEVEAAYLRRMKAAGARLGPPILAETPPAIEGSPVASYTVEPISATLLRGAQDFAYVTAAGSETALLLRRDDKRGVLLALPVRRGRPRRGRPLMTTPLDELDLAQPDWTRAVCAWGAWLLWVLEK